MPGAIPPLRWLRRVELVVLAGAPEVVRRVRVAKVVGALQHPLDRAAGFGVQRNEPLAGLVLTVAHVDHSAAGDSAIRDIPDLLEVDVLTPDVLHLDAAHRALAARTAAQKTWSHSGLLAAASNSRLRSSGVSARPTGLPPA